MINCFLLQEETVKQLHSFKESRLEKLKKKADNLMVSNDTSAEIMIHTPKNVKKVFHRKSPKSLSRALKKKKQKRSSFMSPANDKKVPGAQNPFFLCLFVS